MKLQRIASFKWIVSSMLAFVVLLVPLSNSLAASAVVSTQQVHDKVIQFQAPDPCTGAPATFTYTLNGEIEFVTSNGVSQFSTAETGNVVIDVSGDPNSPYAGNLTQSVVVTSTSSPFNEAVTLNMMTNGQNGATLDYRAIEHITEDPSGINVTIDNATCVD
jgi:hypothetical protein